MTLPRHPHAAHVLKRFPKGSLSAHQDLNMEHNLHAQLHHDEPPQLYCRGLDSGLTVYKAAGTGLCCCAGVCAAAGVLPIADEPGRPECCAGAATRP